MTGMLSDYESAMRMREIVVNLASSVINQSVPQSSLAQVISVDRPNRQASVIMANDTQPVTIRILADDGPFGAGDIVEVSSGRVQRTIYSATAPGGTYIQPALIQAVWASLNGDPVRQHYSSNLSTVANVGDAWYIGRWRNVEDNVGIFKIWIIQNSLTNEAVAEYTLQVTYNQTLGVWTTVIPDNASILTTGGSDFALEVNVSFDPVTLFNMIDIRIRQTSVDPTFQAPFRFEMEIHGNWDQDNTIGESFVSAPAATSQYFTNDNRKGLRSPVYICGYDKAPPLLNSWVAYDGGFTFAQPRFFMDGKGKVRLSGLAKSGAAATVIFTLPVGFRPDYTLIFIGTAATSSPGGTAEIRVDTSGNVTLQAFNNGANNTYVSLDQVCFFPSGTVDWTPVTPTSPIANLGSGFAPLRYYVDVDGIVHWSGVLLGAISNNICTLSGAISPDGTFTEMFTIPAFNGAGRVDAQTAALRLQPAGTSATPATYFSVEGIEYTGANHTLNWHNAGPSAYENSFTPFAGWNPARWCIDSCGVIRWGGLVANATAVTDAVTYPPPSAYWPDYQLILEVFATGQGARIDIPAHATTAGSPVVVGYFTGGGATNLSLAGLKYQTGLKAA